MSKKNKNTNNYVGGIAGSISGGVINNCSADGANVIAINNDIDININAELDNLTTNINNYVDDPKIKEEMLNLITEMKLNQGTPSYKKSYQKLSLLILGCKKLAVEVAVNVIMAKLLTLP